MPKMKAPYTGMPVEVADKKVAHYLEIGFSLIDASSKPVEKTEDEKEALPHVEPLTFPDECSTVAEIKEYANAMNIEFPKKATKEKMLEILEEKCR